MAEEDLPEDIEELEDPNLDVDEDELDDEELDDDIPAVIGDDDDDDVADDEDDEEEDEDGPAPVKKSASDDDDDDEEDDVEADLDAILRDRLASSDDEEDEEDDAAPAGRVVPPPKVGEDVPAKAEDERTCESCWLIKPLVQFPDDGSICVDCS